jgi:hypothetical protein
MKTTQALDFMLDYSVQNALIQTGASSYSNPTDLQGSANLLLNTPFVSAIRGSMTSDN